MELTPDFKEQQKLLFHWVRKGDVKKAKKIGAPLWKLVRYMFDDIGRTILHVAIESMSADMLRYCVTFPIDKNRSAPFIGTPLQYACSMSPLLDDLIIVILLRNGAQFYGMTNIQRSPLLLIYQNHSFAATKKLLEEYDNRSNDRHHLMKPKRRAVQKYIYKRHRAELDEQFEAIRMVGLDYKRAVKNGKWLMPMNDHLQEFTSLIVLDWYKQAPNDFDSCLNLNNSKLTEIFELRKLSDSYIVDRRRISPRSAPRSAQAQQFTLRDFLIFSDTKRQSLVKNNYIVQYFTKHRMEILFNYPKYGAFIINAYDDAVNHQELYKKTMKYMCNHIKILPPEAIQVIFDKVSKGDIINLYCAFQNR